MTTTSEYLSCAETAKLLRAALKAAFPKVKFSVRSDTYSGGASIDVRWTDGPSQTAVERVAKCFQGSDFDSSIDLKVSGYHYQLPDGSLIYGGTAGTVGSMGFIQATNNPMPEGARRVRLLADHVFCRREYSDGANKLIQARADARTPINETDHEREVNKYRHFYRAAEEFDFSPVLFGKKPLLRPSPLNG